jgi:ferric-dicitrate binding protein FerR (iron transport regulator)
MSDNDDRSREGDSETAWRALFAQAKPRAVPPPEDSEEIRRAVYAVWASTTRRRLWQRRLAVLAAAASVVAAVVVLALRLDTAAPLIVAHVERLQGAVATGVDRGGGAALRADAQLTAGASIATATGQVALRLAGGGSLRLGPQSRLTLLGLDSAELESGIVYFDSEDARAQPFAIVTAVGTLRDVGTQFMARIEDGALDVRVRDGGVQLARSAAGAARAGAGERLIAASTGGVRREQTATFGDDWAWAERLAPPFAIDGRKLGDFLDWVAAQTGRRVVLGDPTAERLARETVLSGSIGDLEPLPKLMAVLALTDLEYSLDGDRIVIRSK